MSEKIIDLTRMARKAARALRTTCTHAWARRRSGVERCSSCGDQFPCRKNCRHVDCWVRRLNLGLVTYYPIEWAHRGLTILNDKSRVVYDTVDDDPAEWTLPTRQTKVEDVS